MATLGLDDDARSVLDDAATAFLAFVIRLLGVEAVAQSLQAHGFEYSHHKQTKLQRLRQHKTTLRHMNLGTVYHDLLSQLLIL